MLPRPTSIRTFLVFAVGFALAHAAVATAAGPVVKAPQVDTPTHVLFVGHSYLYYGDSIHNHVQRMVVARWQ